MWLFEPVVWLIACVVCYQSGWVFASGLAGLAFILAGMARAGRAKERADREPTPPTPPTTVPKCEHLWHLRGLTITAAGGTIHDYVCGRCGDGMLSESALGGV